LKKTLYSKGIENHAETAVARMAYAIFQQKGSFSDLWLDFIPQYDIDYIVLKEVW